MDAQADHNASPGMAPTWNDWHSTWDNIIGRHAGRPVVGNASDGRPRFSHGIKENLLLKLVKAINLCSGSGSGSGSLIKDSCRSVCIPALFLARRVTQTTNSPSGCAHRGRIHGGVVVWLCGLNIFAALLAALLVALFDRQNGWGFATQALSTSIVACDDAIEVGCGC